MSAIAFDAPHPTRILDGSDTTHDDAGTATFRGKEYAFFVRRVHVKRTTAWEKRGVYYWAELRRNGRKVRDDALKELRADIVEAFKPRVRALAAAIENGPDALPQPKAPEEPQAMKSTQDRVAALGLTVTHYARLPGNSDYQPMDAVGGTESTERLIVFRKADDRYDFDGWAPWASTPFPSHGGRCQTFEAALAWLEAQAAHQ